jgi:hypothetical protein
MTYMDTAPLSRDNRKGWVAYLLAADKYRRLTHQLFSLNLSAFVDGCSCSIKTGLHHSKTRRFPRYGPENDTA